MKYLDIYNQSNIKLKFERLKDLMDDKIPKKFEENSPAPIATEIKEDEEKDNKNLILKSRDKSIMKISFSMEGINMLLPIEPESSDTYLIYMALEMPINYVVETDAETLYKDSKLINIHYFMKKVQLNIYLKDGNISIYEYKDEIKKNLEEFYL